MKNVFRIEKPAKRFASKQALSMHFIFVYVCLQYIYIFLNRIELSLK